MLTDERFIESIVKSFLQKLRAPQSNRQFLHQTDNTKTWNEIHVKINGNFGEKLNEYFIQIKLGISECIFCIQINFI